MIKRLVFAMVLISFLVSGVAASEESSLTGKDFVRMGEFKEIVGILETCPDEEWYCQTAEILYEIHLGDHDFQREIGLNLTPGAEVVVTGFVYGNDMAVVSITTPVTYQLRTMAGVPLWAGRSRVAQLAAAEGFTDSSAFGAEGGFGDFDLVSGEEPIKEIHEQPSAGVVDDQLERRRGEGLYWLQQQDGLASEGSRGLASGSYVADAEIDCGETTPEVQLVESDE